MSQWHVDVVEGGRGLRRQILVLLFPAHTRTKKPIGTAVRASIPGASAFVWVRHPPSPMYAPHWESYSHNRV